MAGEQAKTGGDIFIVDNSDTDWKVVQYLRDWTELAHQFDIATGYFEIGSLLALDGQWQQLDHIRILMGDEVSYRTKRAFAEGLQKATERLDGSLESEKRDNDFLTGVPAIVEAIRAGKIQCRVYRRDKFHAKCYLTHGRAAVIGSFGLVGSSNFTFPGLSENIELNVQIRGNDVHLLQEWYERHWQDAEDVTADILRTLERHTAPRSPFEIWFKALDEYFRGRELEPDAWDEQKSRIFPRLDKYQQDAYRNLLELAGRHGGAFLCDGVGLGKTFVGLMLIERLVFKEAKQVVLFAPKAVREDVWERDLQRYLPEVFGGFVNLVVYNHTDLQRQGKWPRNIELTLEQADAVIIDEAHHFRNPGIKGEGVKRPSRYRQLQQYLQNGRSKQIFLLTATPVNNSVHDFRHMIELFTGGDDNYFARGTRNLGIHNLRSHFIQLEKRLLSGLSPHSEPLALSLESDALAAAEKTLRTDPLFEALVVQRSRAYVKQSQLQQGASTVLFPKRQPPQVAEYNLSKTYGNLLESVRLAFNKERPLFVLGIYYPLDYWQGPGEHPVQKSFDKGRQMQVVTLIRTLFLKRFESSARAFEGSCWRLLQKLLAWVTVHAESEHYRNRLERWRIKNADLIGYVHAHQLELWPDNANEDEVEDFLDEDILNAVERLDPELFKVDEIINDSLDDLDQLAEFLSEVAKVKPAQDDKLQALIRLLKTDPVLQKEKVIIFSEFADTARYLEQELTRAGISGICRIDGSSSQKQRSDVIMRFSPYYNDSSSPELAARNKEEIRILIATDILSEGLNLQDATRMINYDLHWNPVRLMQRIGRVDRRMNPDVEARLIADHPEQAERRGQIAFWNFLPPDELDELLRLFQRVTKKTLVISRTLGIEGRKLLTPDDTFDPIRELNEQFDGTLSEVEQLRLEYTGLVQAHPDLAESVPNLPLKTFSGKASPRAGTQAVFFCFRIPRPDPDLIEVESGEPRWSDAAGFTLWVCYDLGGEQVLTEPAAIARFIRSRPETPRVCTLDRALLSQIRQKAEKRVVADYLKPLQAPIGITPVLKCWLELN
jgi:superfamily II DNA or RNA helicase